MKLKMTALALSTALVLSACNQDAQQNAEAMQLNTEEQKQAYALGASMARFAQARAEQMAEIGMPFDKAAMVAGFNEALDGKVQFTDEELQTLVQAADQAVREQQNKLASQAAVDNQLAGQTFLAENGSREGVVTTESGLQYEVITAGTGPQPAATDTVEVHYRGTLIDGTEFDSSYARGETATFPLNQVIKGWTEGVQLMNVGSKYKFFIPSELAYGDRAAGQITPNSTLIFDVELISIPSQTAPEAE